MAFYFRYILKADTFSMPWMLQSRLKVEWDIKLHKPATESRDFTLRYVHGGNE